MLKIAEQNSKLSFITFICMSVLFSYTIPLLFLRFIPQSSKLLSENTILYQLELMSPQGSGLSQFKSFLPGALLSLPVLIFLLPHGRGFRDLVILIPLALILVSFCSEILNIWLATLTVTGLILTLSLLKDVLITLFYQGKSRKAEQGIFSSLSAFLLAVLFLGTDLIFLSRRMAELGDPFTHTFENISVSLILCFLSILSLSLFTVLSGNESK